MKAFSKRSSGKKNKLSIAAAVILLIAVAALSSSNSDKFFSGFRPKDNGYNNTLTVLNVGQAKCTLVETEGKYILVDCGNTVETNNILEYLKSRNVKKLDMVILTHFHYDHTSDFAAINRLFNTDLVLIPSLSKENTPDTAFYRKLLENGKKGDYRLETAAKGSEYNIGECVVSVLSDTMNMTSRDTQDSDKRINNTSVCISIRYNDFIFVETGDAEEEVEQFILDTVPENITVFNASHHGSQDSNSLQFLKKMNPLYITVSCGKDNEYSHPSKVFADRVNSLAIPMIVSYEHGNAVFSMTDNTIMDRH